MTGKKSEDQLLELSVSQTSKPLSTTNSIISQFRQKMVHVPGFKPPDTAPEENLCPLPNCSQEDINEFRSAGVLLKALAAEAKAWTATLPSNYRPAIVALLHGNMQLEVRSLAQVSFDGIRVEGVIGDNPVSVLAHQDTIQLMCYAVCTDQVEEEEVVHNHPIGFIWPDHQETI